MSNVECYMLNAGLSKVNGQAFNVKCFMVLTGIQLIHATFIIQHLKKWRH